MTSLLGTTLIGFALLLAIWGILAPILYSWKGRKYLLGTIRAAIFGQFFLVSLASTILVYALVTTDFSIRYVAFNTTLATPLYYRITGLWGALEGSLLLWEWILVIFSTVVARIYKERHQDLMPWVLMICSVMSAFFLSVIIFVSNPFESISPVPMDGRGLNPLLEDANMMTHPPLLYTGFVGLTVPYAFAMAALIVGRLNEDWIVTIRRWTITAWLFLTLGNLVGAWWSYHVLGWGGYWAWDPVENAAFMPWLPATAFLHSIQVQERRHMLKVWNLSLIIIAFSLTIFGTFLTRSGILSSIHSFSSGPVGGIFLGFLSLVLLCSFGLLAWRGNKLRIQPELDSLLSRESAFLLNNVVLVSALFTILLGTIFPLISEALAGNRISVGAPYFNAVTTPLFLLMVFLMAVGPMIAWRKASWDNIKRNLLWPAIASLISAILLLYFSIREFFPLLGFTLSSFVIFTIIFDSTRAVRTRRRIMGEWIGSALLNLTRLNQRRYGGLIVHLGVVLIIMGITGSMSYSREREATLQLNETLSVGRYTVRFEGLKGSQQPTHFRVEGSLRIFINGFDAGIMSPSLKFFPRQESPIGRAVLQSNWLEDLYIILSGFSDLEKNQATLKVLIRPLIVWIWIGGIIITLGTIITIFPFRNIRKINV